MREVTLRVYSFDELDEKAQEAAIGWFLSGDDYPETGDFQATLKAFTDVFPVRMKHWEFDTVRYSFRWEFLEEEEVAELSGPRLGKLLWNRYGDRLYPRKYYRHLSENEKPIKHPCIVSKSFPSGWWNAYRSRIQRETGIALTGYYLDDMALDPIYDFMGDPGETTFRELLGEGLDALFKAVQEDYAYQNSREYAIESIRLNEYEFTADGKIY